MQDSTHVQQPTWEGTFGYVGTRSYLAFGYYDVPRWVDTVQNYHWALDLNFQLFQRLTSRKIATREASLSYWRHLLLLCSVHEMYAA